jgi:hypothetical protein
VQPALDIGIDDVVTLAGSVRSTVDELVGDFQDYEQRMKTGKNQLFRLGGRLRNDNLMIFWTEAQQLWLKLCDGKQEIEITDFILKATDEFCLPNQEWQNAYEAVEWWFSPTTFTNVRFPLFCGFLAQFGPGPTAIRKLKHYLQCQSPLKNHLIPSTVEDLIKPGCNCETIAMNAFHIAVGDQKIIVYNDPFIDTTDSYLVGSDGERYQSWSEFFDGLKTKKK